MIKLELLKNLLFFLNFTILVHSVSILKYGAIPEVNTYEAALTNSKALISAFNFANSAKTDRTVEIPSGNFYFANSTISNIKNVTWIVEGNAIVNNDISKWPQIPNDGGHFAAFEFSNMEDFKLTTINSGQFDGQGYDWWWYVILTGNDHRPHLIQIQQSKNFQIINVYAQNSPQFHFKLHDILNVHIKNVTVWVDVEGQKNIYRKHQKMQKIPKNLISLKDTLISEMEDKDWFEIPTFPLNTDGIDPSGQNVLIEDCYIENFDDAVAIKPLHSGESIFGTNCSNNMIIKNSKVKFGVGMTIGSVPPEIGVNCVKDILFENVTSIEPIKAIYVKTNPGDKGSGMIDNITYRNFQIDESLWYPIWIGPQQQHQPDTKGTGCSFFYPIDPTCPTNPLVPITNIHLTHIHMSSGVTLPGVLLCNSTRPCTGFEWDDVYDEGWFVVRKEYVCENVKGVAKESTPMPPCFSKGF